MRQNKVFLEFFFTKVPLRYWLTRIMGVSLIRPYKYTRPGRKQMGGSLSQLSACGGRVPGSVFAVPAMFCIA